MINEGLISITFSHFKITPNLQLPSHNPLCVSVVCMCVRTHECVSSSFQCPIKQIISYRAFESFQLKKNFLKINCAFH